MAVRLDGKSIMASFFDVSQGFLRPIHYRNIALSPPFFLRIFCATPETRRIPVNNLNIVGKVD